jgi:hypothetical protein
VSFLAFGPLLLSIVGAFGARPIVRALHPRWAAPVLCGVSVAAAASTFAALVLVILATLDGGLAGHVAEAEENMSGVALLLEWCGELYDHQAPRWAGLAAAAVLALGIARVVACRRRWRAAVAPWHGAAPVQVIPGESTEAFAVPGRPGAVVVGQGLLDVLEPGERRVVLAHERAHLTHRHHRYVQAADITAAAFPFLSPIASQVRYATERWADEVAARTVGDRRLVACTIIKAALTTTREMPLPAAAAGHVTARVDALLNQHSDRRQRLWAIRASWLSVAMTLTAASVQLHHLGVYVTHASHGHL